jgi:Lon protease-like protein
MNSERPHIAAAAMRDDVVAHDAEAKAGALDIASTTAAACAEAHAHRARPIAVSGVRSSQPPRLAAAAPSPLVSGAMEDAAHERAVVTAAPAVSMSDFECSVCYQLLCEPLTMPCGHTFCRVCAVNFLERSKKKCPTCRSPCHIEASTHPACVILSTLIQRSFPEAYEQRMRDCLAEKKSWADKIPLFFTPTPMYPFQPLSLHLFEPRYRLMITRVLSGNRRFGVVATSRVKDGDVGTVFEVLECEFLADGRALCECVGRERFEIGSWWVEDGTQGLHYAKMRPLVDLPEEAVVAPAAAAAAALPVAASTPSPYAPPSALSSSSSSSASSSSSSASSPSSLSATASTIPMPPAAGSSDALPAAQGAPGAACAAPAAAASAASSSATIDDRAAALQARVNRLCAHVREHMREFYRLVPQSVQLEHHYGPMPGGLQGFQGDVRPSDAMKLSFWVSSILPLETSVKNQLLSVTSTVKRLGAAVSLLRAVVHEIRQQHESGARPPAEPSQGPAPPPSGGNDGGAPRGAPMPPPPPAPREAE